MKLITDGGISGGGVDESQKSGSHARPDLKIKTEYN
jgi:hypothetical protein